MEPNIYRRINRLTLTHMNTWDRLHTDNRNNISLTASKLKKKAKLDQRSTTYCFIDCHSFLCYCFYSYTYCMIAVM